MAKENPFLSCFDSAILEDRPLGDQILATEPRATWKKKKAQGEKAQAEGKFLSLDELPKRWWKQAANSRGGYQYQTEVKILDRYVSCLLDGCAGCNSITEEVVMGAIRAALRAGISPSSKEFPVAQLEKWPKEEVVMGLANGAPIKLKGAAVLKVTLPDVNGKKSEEILARAKVIDNGGSTWHGLILGGRALDAVERGGLGFRPAATAHIFDALGLTLPRKEEMEEYSDHAYPHVAVQQSLFERTWDGMSKPEEDYLQTSC